MPSLTTIPHTARAVLAFGLPFGPAVEGQQLVFAADLPAGLEHVLSVLHTGVRALLTRRQWWGSSDITATLPQVGILIPDEPIPLWCALLCVAGDTMWDRIGSSVRDDDPELFVPVERLI